MPLAGDAGRSEIYRLWTSFSSQFTLRKLCAGSWLAGGAKAERGVAGFSAEGCGNRRIGVSISAVERLFSSLQTHYPPSRTSRLRCR
jgi:hypothetical protein